MNISQGSVLRHQDESDWHTGEDIHLLTALAALLHDLGKACRAFQMRLEGNLQERNQYRHEWVSLRLFEAFVGQDDDATWLARLTAPSPADDATWLDHGQGRFRRDGLDGPVPSPFYGMARAPLAQAIGWLVVSHHRLPTLPRSWGEFQIGQLSNVLQRIDAGWNERTDGGDTKYLSLYWQFPHGLPVTTELWRKRASCLAQRLQSLHVQPGKGNWLANPYVMHISRLCLMLADHHYSSLSGQDMGRVEVPKDYPLYANINGNPGDFNQTLDEHLLGVAQHSVEVTHALPRFEEQLPRHKGLRKQAQDPRFCWQDKASDTAQAMRERSVRHGAFIVNMASTGCGKTLANARIMYALADAEHGMRCAFAMGLRTLTLQTGQAFRDLLGLNADELAIRIGDSASRALFEHYEVQAEATGSASRQALIDENSHVVFEGNQEAHPLLRRVMHDAQVRSLLIAPLLVCTIDHLTPATESERGGRQIAPMLRLMSGDLVLDEPDDFDINDLPALTRLVHWAGLLGARVLLSSATLPPALVQGLFEAYRNGRHHFQRNRGEQQCATDRAPEVCCAWFDEFNQSQADCADAQEFVTTHEAFAAKRHDRLGTAQVRRRGALLPLDLGALNQDQHPARFAELVRDAALKLHRQHHSVDTHSAKAPLITATGTPISNSLAEMFTMQRYMQYDKLKANGLHVFDAWAKQYGDVQNVYEVAPSGTGYRLSQRFAKFKNLPSLMGEYRSFADVITLDDLKAQEAALGKTFPVPKLAGGRPLNVVASRSELQERFFGIPEIVRDADGKIKFEIDLNFPVTIGPREDGKFVMTQDMGKNYVKTSKAYDTKEEAEYMTALGATTPMMTVDPKSIVGQFENLRELTRSTKGKINALSLTGLANKAGLDYRLINPGAVDFAKSKVNLAVINMLATAKKWDKDKGVQLVFCDLSVPLSAKAKMAAKEKRVYVRDDKGGVAHKKGTLHTVKNYEGLPYYLVADGKGNAKTFSMYDPVTGALMKNGLDSKQDAHAFVANFVAKEGGQERWLDLREKSLPIDADEIDEYKNEHAIDADGDAADLEISAQDVEGASGVAGFSIYDDMKAKLIAGGVPAAQIEFIHDHDTPQAKDALFKRVNAGDVRFLFGSTPKMGAGTNVQQRLVALHHIDAPWRPSDLEQREGRIIRRGNLLYERDPVGFEIEVNRYATAQTYDTRRWQLLEHKASGLEQLRNYDGANEIDDVANEASNSADMKAAASGNPLILKETQLSNDVKRLRMLERAHRDGEYSIRSRMNSNLYCAEKSGPKELADLCELQAQRDTAAVLGVYGGKPLMDKEEVMVALKKIGDAIAVSADTKSLVYRGAKFDFKQGFLAVDILMDTPDGYSYRMDKLSPSGVLTRLENWCDGIEGKIASCERRIVVHKAEAAKMAGQMGKSFDRADDLLASINEHGKVQRALMKSNSMAAVKPEEMAVFQAAVDGQKAILRAIGLGRVVSEIEGEGEEHVGVAMSLADVPAMADKNFFYVCGVSGMKEDGSFTLEKRHWAMFSREGVLSMQDSDRMPHGASKRGVFIGEKSGNRLNITKIVTPQVPTKDMAAYIKVAANSIGELRKTDVYRVLVESNRIEFRIAIASYIKSARPDLVEEVDDVIKDAREEELAKQRTSQVVSVAPASLFGLSGSQIEAMQGGKLRGADQFPGVTPSKAQIEARVSAVVLTLENEILAVDAAVGQDVRLEALRDAGIPAGQILQAAKELGEGDNGLLIDIARIAGVSLPAVFSLEAESLALGEVVMGRRLPLVDVDHIKTRMIDSLSIEVPLGAVVMNAPRPLLGSQTMEGNFVSGRFYAVILPDDPMAARFVEENRKLDARLLAVISRDTRMELGMHESGRRDEYIALVPDPVERYECLAGSISKFQDMPFGELTKAICEAMGAVKEGAFSGLVTGVADGLVTQRVNRDGATVRHDVAKLSVAVKEGDLVDIQYRGGIGMVKGPDINLGLGR